MRYVLLLLLSLAATQLLAADKPVTVKVPPADGVRIINRKDGLGWNGAKPGEKVTLAPGEGLSITRYNRGPGDLEYLDKLGVLHHLNIERCRMDDSDFTALGKLKNLRSLAISGDHPSPALANLTGLRHLRIWGGDRTALVLTHTAGLPGLTNLAVSEADLSNPELRAALCAHKGLKTLNIGVVPQATGADVSCLATLPKMESLEICIASSGDGAASFLRALARHEALRRLSIKLDSDQPEAFLAAIAQIEGLQKLAVRFDGEARVTDEMIAPLSRLPALRSLEVRGAPALTGKGLSGFEKHGALQSLTLRWESSVDDGGAAEIAKIRSLTTLSVSSSALTEAGLRSLGALPLESLDLSGCREISPAGLAALGTFQTLRVLDLRGTELDDVGLTAIAELHGLTELDVSATAITSAGAARLGSLPNLMTLKCSVCAKLGDNGLEAWSSLPLRVLDVSETGITDRGVKALASIQTLVELDLTQTRVTDEGVAAVASLKGLSLLRVDNCYLLTAACARALARAPALRCVVIRNVPNLDADKFDRMMHRVGVGTFSDATELINEPVRGVGDEQPPLPPLPAPADSDQKSQT